MAKGVGLAAGRGRCQARTGIPTGTGSPSSGCAEKTGRGAQQHKGAVDSGRRKSHALRASPLP